MDAKTRIIYSSSSADGMQRDAAISADGLYRYSLHRDWWEPAASRRRWVTFVMLNPSIADADQDDPTIRRCVTFAKQMGGTGLAVVNLYALRATAPADLWSADDPVGPHNDRQLELFLARAANYDFPIIAAWGAHARPDRVATVLAMPGAERLQAFGTTQSGAPRHPLYLPAGAQARPWRTPAAEKAGA